MTPREAAGDRQEVAAISARVHRLVARHPEPGNALWITVIVTGFLLVIPIVGGAAYLCVLLRVSFALGAVFGMAAWLGAFMFLRQCMFWRRQAQVEAVLRDFNASFPTGSDREAALVCLKAIQDEDNEVLVLARERLGGGDGAAGHRRPAVIALGTAWSAGAGLESASDPRIDGQVAQILASLQGRLQVLRFFHYLLGGAVPAAFFILGGIYAPKETGGLICGTVGVAAVWNFLLAFLVGVAETFIAGGPERAFNTLFPAGGPERAVARAAFTRVPGYDRAKACLRIQLGDGDEERDADAAAGAEGAESQAPGPAPQPEVAPGSRPRAVAHPDVAPAAAPAAPAAPTAPAARAVPALEVEPAPSGADAGVRGPVSAAAAAPQGGPRIAIEPESAVALAPEVPGVPAAAPAPALDPRPQGRFCAQCGGPLEAHDRFCTRCGGKVA